MAIKSVEKTVDILNCFRIDKPVLSVKEISAITGFSKSTVSRLLSTLEQKGCLERTKELGSYSLGLKFYVWGNIVQHQIGLAEIAAPIMEELRNSTGEEVSLYVLQGDSRICIKKVASKYEVAKVSTTGKSLPLHCGASGKLLLAYLPAELRTKLILKNKLKKYTSFTITDPEELERNLEQIRKQGYAVSTNEREIGAYSVVAPIWDTNKKVIANLTVSGPTFRLSEDVLQVLINKVLAAAGKISVKLGYEGGGDNKAGNM